MLGEIQGYPSEIYNIKCEVLSCFFVIGIVNSEKQLVLYLYRNPTNDCLSTVVSSTIINVGSDSFSCQIMKTSFDEELLTCFYQNNNINEIVASSFNIDLNIESIESIETLTKSKANNGMKIIKSKLSQDKKKSYVCYINSDNNCVCLTYNIINNEWSDDSTYLKDCLPNKNSLFFDYYENSKEYFLYCYQSSSKVNLVKLDENFEIKNEYIFDLQEENCIFSSFIYHATNLSIFQTNNEKFNALSIEKYLFDTKTLTSIISTTTPTTLFVPDTTFINAPTTLLKPTSILSSSL